MANDSYPRSWAVIITAKSNIELYSKRFACQK